LNTAASCLNKKTTFKVKIENVISSFLLIFNVSALFIKSVFGMKRQICVVVLYLTYLSVKIGNLHTSAEMLVYYAVNKSNYYKIYKHRRLYCNNRLHACTIIYFIIITITKITKKSLNLLIIITILSTNRVVIRVIL